MFSQKGVNPYVNALQPASSLPPACPPACLQPLYVLSDYPPQLFLVARGRNTPAVRRHCLNCTDILTEKEHGATLSPVHTAPICQRTCRPTGGATTKSAHSTSLSEGRFNQSPSSSSRASGKAQAGAAFAHSANGTSMSESDSSWFFSHASLR